MFILTSLLIHYYVYIIPTILARPTSWPRQTYYMICKHMCYKLYIVIQLVVTNSIFIMLYYFMLYCRAIFVILCYIAILFVKQYTYCKILARPTSWPRPWSARPPPGCYQYYYDYYMIMIINIYIYIYMYIYVYIFIYIEREIQIQIERERYVLLLLLSL